MSPPVLGSLSLRTPSSFEQQFVPFAESDSTQAAVAEDGQVLM
jgi:hypothetical protein